VALKMRMRDTLKKWGGRVRRHPKKTAGAGVGLGVLIWLGVGLWTTYEINRMSVENRFARAEKDIAGGPRQQVYELVLEHERLVRALAARGTVPAPLVQMDGGVADPMMQEILRPPTLAEKVHVKRRATQSPEAVAALLQKRNAELRSELGEGTSPMLAPEINQLTTASDAPPDSTLELNRVTRSANQVQVRAGQSQQSLEAADQIKALCAARGDSVKEFGKACEDPELFITRGAGEPTR
jgi:hypothetical protein